MASSLSMAEAASLAGALRALPTHEMGHWAVQHFSSWHDMLDLTSSLPQVLSNILS